MFGDDAQLNGDGTREDFEYIPLVAMSPEQHARLSQIREQNPGIEVSPDQFGTVRAVVPLDGYPSEHVAVRHDPDELLDRVEEIIADSG